MKGKVLSNLIVHVENNRKQEIQYGSLKLLTPDSVTKFNEFENRNDFGVVVGCPEYKDVKKGDTVWFHHNIVINQTNAMSMAKNKRNVSHKYRIDSEKNYYIVPYFESEYNINCMAYLVKDSKTGIKKSLNYFVFGEPVKKDDLVEEKGILIKNQHRQGFALECCVKYISDYAKTFGLAEGDIVGVTNNADYLMGIEDEKLWRFPVNSIAYIIRNEEFIPFADNAIIKLHDKKKTIGSFELAISAQEASNKATIIAKGDRCLEVEVGDNVILEGSDIYNIYEKDGVEYYLISENKITGILL